MKNDKLKRKNPALIAVSVIFIILAVTACSGKDEPQKVETTTSTQNVETSATQAENETDAENKNTFSVGETAELKGVNVTFVGVTESSGSDFNTPTEGNVFAICEFEIENNSDKEITVSSMMSFEAYCDDYTCTLSFSALMEKGNKNQLDGTVAAGKKFNGVIGYEVPTDWQELEIIFTPDFWSGKDITFIATND